MAPQIGARAIQPASSRQGEDLLVYFVVDLLLLLFGLWVICLTSFFDCCLLWH
jgi:hypothetical protein